MAIDEIAELVQGFVSWKEHVLPILEERQQTIPLYRTPAGDGLFYGDDDRFHYKYGMSGHDEPATIESLLAAMQRYKGPGVTLKEALRDAGGAFLGWYMHLLNTEGQAT
jgi:hypothetical protein